MKISFFLRSVLLSLSAAACLSVHANASEMLYYFNFDDGTNKNSVTGSVAGTLDGSAAFESSGGFRNSGYMKSPAVLGLQLTGLSNVTFSEGFALSVHLKDNGTANWKDYFEIGNGTNRFRLEKTDAANVAVDVYSAGSGTTDFFKDVPHAFALGTDWSHVVFSFSGNRLTVYVNGVKAVSNALDSTALGAVTQIYFGSAQGRGAANAFFDDIAFYKNGITDQQVALLGLYKADDPIQTGGLASRDGVYTYWRDDMFLGASVEGLTLSQLSTFDQGVAQNYRFTTADAPANLGGQVAHSFTVSSLLSDGASPRGLAVAGQDNAESRTVTITNDANSFTGDVSIQKSTLKVQSGGNVTKPTAVTLLGSGNKIILQSKGTLNLATGDGAYLYSNGISFAQTGGKIIQSTGTHTLTGDISLSADGTMENASATALALTGKILETAASTLSLKTMADANSTLSLTGGSLKLTGLNLTGNISSQGGTLDVSTLTLNGATTLNLAQTTLVLGTGGVTAPAGGNVIRLDSESSARAAGNFESAAGVAWDLAENSSFQFDTGSFNVKILGTLSGQETTLVKAGTGSLTLSNTVSGIDSLQITNGGVAFGKASSLSGLKTLDMGNRTSLDLGGFSGNTGQTMNVTQNSKLQGASSYAGTIAMSTEYSRLEVAGDFKAGRITFELGWNNASSETSTFPLVTLTGKAAISGTTEGSIVLNFDPEYLRLSMDKGGMFQLFSSGLTYQKGIIQNNQKQLVLVDDTFLKTNGSIIWSVAALSADLVTQQNMDEWTEYTPSSNSSYLGSDGGTVVVGSDITYNIGNSTSYKMTPGKGTLVYQGDISGETALYILDYASIDKEAENSTGSVVITHNGNTYTNGTNVNGTTLVVDLSQGDDTGLADQARDRNLNVAALSNGEVVGVKGTNGNAVIVLQAYGNGTLEGVDTFTYANDFNLSGGSTLKQAGSNAQILTGNLTFETGANILVNEGNKSLTIKGNITQTTADELTLKSTSPEGKIVLDGNGTLDANKLRLAGTGNIEAQNGYNIKVWGLTIDEATLSIKKNSILSVGKNGLSGSGTLVLDGGTLTSASSWNSNMAITLGTGANTINTGGANIRLEKGVTGSGGFSKQGSGSLYIQDNGENNARGLIDVKQGRLILLGASSSQTRDIPASPSSEYRLNGDLVLSSGKGASLSGMIDANGHNVTFGDKTNFYLSAGEGDGLTGYIRNADTLSFGTGTQLRVDILGEDWVTDKTYTVFSATNSILGADNLELALEEDFAFVNVSLDKSRPNEIGLTLTQKTTGPTGNVYAPTNAGAISRVVTPMVGDVLAGNSELTGKLMKTMQTVSRMTASEYETYLTDMGHTASSFHSALAAQVQDMTQHINSVRNRVELLNPVTFDDWDKGGICNVWAGGVNRYRDVKSGDQSPGYEMVSWGGELGYAVPLSESFMLGVGFAYTFTDVQVNDGWGKNENDTYNVDFFARYRKNAWTITGVLTGGFSHVEFHRNQLVKDEFTTSHSSTDGNQFLGTLEVGYDFYLNEEKSWILQPLVNVTAGRAKLDGLTETGELKNAGLIIGSQSYDMFSAGAGARLAYLYKNSVSDIPGRVELKAMYVNDMGDVDFAVNGRFIGAPGNGFDLEGVSNERSAALVSAGWIAPISAFGQFFVDAGCEFRKDQNGVNTTIGFSFQF